MIISGTIFLNEKANKNYQFIYGSMYDGNFLGLYANFIIKKTILTAINLKLINYTQKDIFSIKSAEIASDLEEKSSRNTQLDSKTSSTIKCLSLTVDIAKSDVLNDAFTLKANHKLDSLENNFLEVLRDGDDGTDKNQNIQVDDCKEDLKSAPGRICPRAYNFIVT